MTTAVTICNSALMALGASPITSLSDDSDRARICSQVIETARRALLRSHRWNCNTARAVLSPSVTAPSHGYDYAFDVPPDLLRIYSVTDSDGGPDIDYTLESNQILCDSATIYLVYGYDNDVYTNWDALLVEALSLKIKATIAYMITQSTSAEATALAALENAMKRARAVDGQDNPPETLGDFPLLSARF